MEVVQTILDEINQEIRYAINNGRVLVVEDEGAIQRPGRVRIRSAVALPSIGSDNSSLRSVSQRPKKSRRPSGENAGAVGQSTSCSIRRVAALRDRS